MRYRKNPSLITGSITPLVTPFDAEGHVDHPSLRSLVDWQLRAGTHGLSIGGSTLLRDAADLIDLEAEIL